MLSEFLHDLAVDQRCPEKELALTFRVYNTAFKDIKEAFLFFRKFFPKLYQGNSSKRRPLQLKLESALKRVLALGGTYES